MGRLEGLLPNADSGVPCLRFGCMTRRIVSPSLSIYSEPAQMQGFSKLMLRESLGERITNLVT